MMGKVTFLRVCANASRRSDGGSVIQIKLKARSGLEMGLSLTIELDGDTGVVLKDDSYS